MLETFWSFGGDFGGVLEVLERFWRVGGILEVLERFWRCWRDFGDVEEVLEMLERSVLETVLCLGVQTVTEQHVAANRRYPRCVQAVSARLQAARLLLGRFLSACVAQEQRFHPQGKADRDERDGARGVSTLLKAWKKIGRGKDTGLLNRNLLAGPRG